MGFASRTTLIASAVVALGLAGAPQAVATTAVSGAGDASSPLLIDPRTSPSDALQLRLNVGSPAPVAFIERMPVTKTIEDVSLGDFQADPGDCANPMQLYLMVREHPAGDADQAIQVAYAPAQPTVPDSAGVMTWRLDQPVTLQAGRGYSFAIMSTDPASCHFLYQTTWDHNGAQVEGGTNQCASGVRFGENDSVLLKRGWHTQGVSDGVYGPDGCAGSKWDPGLSEGWLVSIPSGDAWDVATAAIAQGLPVPPPPPDSCTINDNHLDPGYGAEQLQYYPVNYPPGPVSYDYYLCRWTQFAAPGHQLPDGWYYGLPWRTERRGAPRDVYVKLASATAAYVALGDSFQSGLGAGDYESGTTGESSTCYRSNNAYPHQLVNDGAVTGGLDFAACKGAKINDLYTGLNGEGPQLDHLSDRTRLATVGIGGNDLGFADTLLACIKRLVSTASCEQDFDADVMNRLLALQNHGSMDPRNQFQRLYSDIRFRAPDAGILAVDYPRFFPLDGGWDWTTIPAVIADPLTSLDAIKRCAGIRLSDQMWINEKIHMLDEVVEASALSMGVEPVRMYGAFAGHELCADGDSWLHGIQAPFIGNVSESFHPNAPGQTAFAKAIEDVLAGRSGASPGTQYALLPGGTQTQTLDVASGTPGLTASTSWPGSDVVTSLVSPSGRVINRDTSAADVFHRVAPTRELYYVRDPEPGTWTIKVYGANVRPGGELVTLTTYKEPKPNDSPIARMNVSQMSRNAIDVDARDSTDSDGQVTDYLWDFGDGTYATGSHVHHVFSAPGTYRVNLVVRDDHKALGFATADHDFTITPYAFNGFFAPINNQPVLNGVRAGQAIPVKFSLGGAQGSDILDPGYPKVRVITCDTGAPLDEIETTVTANASGLTYDPKSDTYTYVWKTDPAWAGTCHRLEVGLNDATRHVADFKFR